MILGLSRGGRKGEEKLSQKACLHFPLGKQGRVAPLLRQLQFASLSRPLDGWSISSPEFPVTSLTTDVQVLVRLLALLQRPVRLHSQTGRPGVPGGPQPHPHPTLPTSPPHLPASPSLRHLPPLLPSPSCNGGSPLRSHGPATGLQ